MPDLYGNPLPGEQATGAVRRDLYGNPIAAASVAPPAEEGGIISSVVDVLGRPGYASAAFANALLNEGQGIGGALSTAGSELLSPTQRLSYGDVIGRAAPEFAAENPLLTKAAGFIGDVALDPTTYVGLGLGAKALSKTGKVGLETVSAIRKAGLLSSPKTHIKNILGSGLFQASEEVARIPAVLGDIVASAFTKRRTVTGPSISAVARSTYEAATKGVKEAREILSKGLTPQQMEQYQLSAINSGSAIVDGYVNGVFKLLAAEDRIPRAFAYRRALESGARAMALTEKRAGKIPAGQIGPRTMAILKNPPPSLEAEAIAQSEIAIFVNENKLSSAIAAARSQLSPGANFGIDLIIPFTKTPTNIIARMLEYTPYGFGKNTVAIARAITKKSFTEAQQRQFAQTFGRASIGSGLIALGYKLYQDGKLTGLYEDDPSRRSREQAAGRPPGALKVGNTYYQITGIAPLGSLLAIGASLAREANQEREEGQEGQTFTKLAGIAGQAIGEQPLLTGTKQVVEGITRPGQLPEVAGRIAGSFVPTAVSDIGEAIDPSQREAQGFTAQIQKRIPGLRQALPERIDALGRPITDPGIKQLYDFTRSSPESGDPVIAELTRLDRGLSALRRKPGEKERDYRQRATNFGQLYTGAATQLLNNPQYQRASEALKKKAFDSLNNRVKVQLNDEADQPNRAVRRGARLNPNQIMRAVLDSARKKPGQ